MARTIPRFRIPRDSTLEIWIEHDDDLPEKEFVCLLGVDYYELEVLPDSIDITEASEGAPAEVSLDQSGLAAIIHSTKANPDALPVVFHRIRKPNGRNYGEIRQCPLPGDVDACVIQCAIEE